jgi:hypothetical protein
MKMFARVAARPRWQSAGASYFSYQEKILDRRNVVGASVARSRPTLGGANNPRKDPGTSFAAETD